MRILSVLSLPAADSDQAGCMPCLCRLGDMLLWAALLLLGESCPHREVGHGGRCTFLTQLLLPGLG